MEGEEGGACGKYFQANDVIIRDIRLFLLGLLKTQATATPFVEDCTPVKDSKKRVTPREKTPIKDSKNA